MFILKQINLLFILFVNLLDQNGTRSSVHTAYYHTDKKEYDNLILFRFLSDINYYIKINFQDNG